MFHVKQFPPLTLSISIAFFENFNVPSLNRTLKIALSFSMTYNAVPEIMVTFG